MNNIKLNTVDEMLRVSGDPVRFAKALADVRKVRAKKSKIVKDNYDPTVERMVRDMRKEKKLNITGTKKEFDLYDFIERETFTSLSNQGVMVIDLRHWKER